MIKLQMVYKHNGVVNNAVTLRESGPYTEIVSEHGKRIALVESGYALAMVLNDMIEGVYA